MCHFQVESLRAGAFFTMFSFPDPTNANSYVEVDPGSQSNYNTISRSLLSPHFEHVPWVQKHLLCSATEIFVLFV